MPFVERPGGVRIHWQERGSGPLVLIASYWNMHPVAVEPLSAELAGDHRVVRYDDRGSGRSTLSGPYDIQTAADDLEAVAEAAGGDAVAVSTADGANRAVRVAARRPDLVREVVSMGGAPLDRRRFDQSEALVGSDSVVGALIRQAETDYRGTLRSLLAATNTQLSDDELRERVNAQAEWTPQEAAAARLRAYADDDSLEQARAVGDRLHVLVSEALSGGWFPTGSEMAGYVRRFLPEARISEVDDGWYSRPDQFAAIVRTLTGARTGAEHGTQVEP